MPTLHKNITASADIHNPKWFPDANNGDVAWRNEKGELESTDELVLPAALNFVDASVAPPTTNDGDIYVLSSGGSVNAGWGAVSLDDWVRYDLANTTWNSITPQKSSLCYDKTADKLFSYDGADWNQVGGDSIYTASGTVPTSVVATLTDSLTFKGADLLGTSSNIKIVDSASADLWDFRNNGDIYQGKDSIVYLQDNKLTLSYDVDTATETAPLNFEFGGFWQGYTRWNEYGEVTMKTSGNGSPLTILNKVSPSNAVFRVDREGGGYLSTYGNRLWLIAEATSSTTKTEFLDDRWSQYWAGTEYHRIQTSGAGTGVHFFQTGISGSLGYFIVGNSSRIGSENISLQGRTLVQGPGTAGTNIAFEVYDSDTPLASKFEIRSNGDIYTNGTQGLSATYTFGGGTTGDIASMTFTNGILTAVTTVP